ncbi:PIN domain-containing protein [Oscillatoria acuminata]|uniref:PIN domain-containing protein n=1 Tax=Oscillatoria acuminata TaxID=118323 RepID=UPI0002E7A7BE|nr:type II toxin-antitoxin system VapC family toxin [Oscillatoria acuminata]
MRDDESQWLKADQYINQALDTDELCLINNIVLCEVVWVLRSRYKLSRQKLIAILENLLNTNFFIFENREAIEWAVDPIKSGNADFSDYLIVRINQIAGCDETASFDIKLGQLPEVKRLDS